MIVRLILLILFVIFSYNIRAEGPECNDSASLRKWMKTVESKYQKRKISKDSLRKLYLGDSEEAKAVTLFYPKIFKDVVLTSNLAVDCHDNLLNALMEKQKPKFTETFIRLWGNCAKRIYEGRADKMIDKTLSCLNKQKQPTKK